MYRLPTHPVTGLRALGMSKRGPIWPVLGGSEDADVVDPTGEPDAPEMTAQGFPKGTPVADMTPEQQAAYWKHQSRKHENTVKAFAGKTPKQITELETQLEQLKTERMSAEEKAVAEAVAQAQEATRTAVEQEWQGKYRTARLEAVAGQILTDKEQLASFMNIVDTSKFVGADGDIDTEAVMGHLTAIYGKPREFGSSLPQHVNWGQHGSKPPAPSGAALGKAEAEKRFGKKPTS